MAIYELAYPEPEITTKDVSLVIFLHGVFADAGRVSTIISHLLKNGMECERLLDFDGDVFTDYTNRRPRLIVDAHTLFPIEDIDIHLDLLTDPNGRQILFLNGHEPDYNWKKFARAIAEIVKRFSIKSVFTLYSTAMTVPHTRPQIVSAHGNDPSIIADYFNIDDPQTIPGAAQLYIEYALMEHTSARVIGFNCHVPHYAAGADYPISALALLEAIEKHTGVQLPLASLEKDVEESLESINSQANNDSDLSNMLGKLEDQYDIIMKEFHDRIPSQEILDAELEKFLSELEGDN